MRTSLLSVSILAFASTVACAQGENKQTAQHNSDPDKVTATGGITAPGWTGRIDPQSEKQGRKISDVKFEKKGTAFHVTSGPAAIYWDPSVSPTGNYLLGTSFTQNKPAAHAEGYGIIFAGKNLTAANQSYFYFLVRQDGKFLLNHRADDSTVHKIVPWTEHAAINKVPEGGKATNRLQINFYDKDVAFLVNGTEVHRVSRAELGGIANTSGIAGIRVNHNLDVDFDGITWGKAK
jgi:hypothetical protein